MKIKQIAYISVKISIFGILLNLKPTLMDFLNGWVYVCCIF